MKFFRIAAGYTFYDHKQNGEILEYLKVDPANEKLRRYTLTLILLMWRIG
jgi:hypothetical protein